MTFELISAGEGGGELGGGGDEVGRGHSPCRGPELGGRLRYRSSRIMVKSMNFVLSMKEKPVRSHRQLKETPDQTPYLDQNPTQLWNKEDCQTGSITHSS